MKPCATTACPYPARPQRKLCNVCTHRAALEPGALGRKRRKRAPIRACPRCAKPVTDGRRDYCTVECGEAAQQERLGRERTRTGIGMRPTSAAELYATDVLEWLASKSGASVPRSDVWDKRQEGD